MKLCKHISFKEALNLDIVSGFVLQGCYGDPDIWYLNINRSLTSFDVLLGGTIIRNVYYFTHEDRQCFVFDFKGTQYDSEKFEEWRRLSFDNYEGMHYIDYVALNR